MQWVDVVANTCDLPIDNLIVALCPMLYPNSATQSLVELDSLLAPQLKLQDAVRLLDDSSFNYSVARSFSQFWKRLEALAPLHAVASRINVTPADIESSMLPDAAVAGQFFAASEGVADLMLFSHFMDSRGTLAYLGIWKLFTFGSLTLSKWDADGCTIALIEEVFDTAQTGALERLVARGASQAKVNKELAFVMSTFIADVFQNASMLSFVFEVSSIADDLRLAVTLVYGAKAEKEAILVRNYPRLVAEFAALSAMLLPSLSSAETFTLADSLRLQVMPAGSVLEQGTLQFMESRFLPLLAAIEAAPGTTSERVTYAVALLNRGQAAVITAPGGGAPSAISSSIASTSASAPMRALMISVPIEALDLKLSALFGATKVNHVKIIDAAIRVAGVPGLGRVCVPVARLVFGFASSLVGSPESVGRLTECRGSLPDYWFEVLMAKDEDNSGTVVVHDEVQKVKAHWLALNSGPSSLSKHAQNMDWHLIDFWAVHTFIEEAVFQAAPTVVPVSEAFVTKERFLLLRPVVDRFLTGFGVRSRAFTKTTESLIAPYTVADAIAQAHPLQAAGLRSAIVSAIADLFREMQQGFFSAFTSPAALSVIPFKGDALSDNTTDFSRAVTTILADVSDRNKKRSSVFGNTDATAVIDELRQQLMVQQQQIGALSQYSGAPDLHQATPVSYSHAQCHACYMASSVAACSYPCGDHYKCKCRAVSCHCVHVHTTYCSIM